MDKENLYQTLLAFLKESKPRRVPSQFIRPNPIAGKFIAAGVVFITMLICLTFVILNILHTRSSRGQSASPYVLFVPGIMLPIPLLSLLYGLSTRKKSVNYLANGDLAKGLVLSVKPLGVRTMDGNTFFEVKVKYNTAENDNLVAKDVIDIWAMEYFLDARDNKTMVDLVFLSGIPKKVLLIRKIVMTGRFG